MFYTNLRICFIIIYGIIFLKYVSLYLVHYTGIYSMALFESLVLFQLDVMLVKGV